MQKHTILWADDDMDDLDMFREVLNQQTREYQVLEFHNGRDLLTHLQSMPQKTYPSLIILVMNMPVLSGRDTLAILKRENNFTEIPVIVFTTSASEMDKLFCKRFGVEMITKPLSFTSLQEVMKLIPNFCNH